MTRSLGDASLVDWKVVVDEFLKGTSLTALANAHGISLTTTRAHLKLEMGLEKYKKTVNYRQLSRLWKPEEIERAVKGRESGALMRVIGAWFGVTDSTVKNMLCREKGKDYPTDDF